MAITCSIVISEPMQQPVMTCAALRSHGGIGGTSFVSLSSAVAVSEKVIRSGRDPCPTADQSGCQRSGQHR